MPPQESQITFLSLPLRARLRIYEYLLVSKPQVIPDCRPATERPLTLSILRTCKQINREASQTLYSKNTFLISEPDRDLKWFNKIGRINVKLLKDIRLFIHPVYSIQKTLFHTGSESISWYKVLDHLAREATGLRHVYIYWDAEETCGHYGAGKDLRFVRELAKIQGLQSMIVEGYYAVHWPRYLTEKMGLQVQEDEQSPFLRKYQLGTQSLIP